MARLQNKCFIFLGLFILLSSLVCVKNTPNEFEVDEDAHLFLADTVGTQPYTLRADSNCFEISVAGDMVRFVKGYHEIQTGDMRQISNLNPMGFIAVFIGQAFFVGRNAEVGIAAERSEWCYLFCVDENPEDNVGTIFPLVDERVMEVNSRNDCYSLNDRAVRISQQAGPHKISVTGELASGPAGVIVTYEETAFCVLPGYSNEFETLTDEDIFVFFVDQYASDNVGTLTVHFK